MKQILVVSNYYSPDIPPHPLHSLVMDRGASDDTATSSTSVSQHVHTNINILYTIVTSNSRGKLKHGHSLMKVLQYCLSTVVVRTPKINYKSGETINAYMKEAHTSITVCEVNRSTSAEGVQNLEDKKLHEAPRAY